MYCEWVMKIFGMWVGRRTESDWTADGIRLDGGRNPIGRRTEHDERHGEHKEHRENAEV